MCRLQGEQISANFEKIWKLNNFEKIWKKRTIYIFK